MTSKLHIQLLGEFRLTGDDGAPVTGANTPRLQSLLAYLLLHRDAPQSRSHIAFQFWPDSTEAQARGNLRTLLHRLRGALPDAGQFLTVDTQSVQWRPEAPCTLDVASFEAALTQAEGAGQAGEQAQEQGALEQAVDLYGGDLLPSCYDDWILPQRERLLQAYLRALERLIGLLEDQRAFEQASRYARRLLRHDPLHEAGYRRLMRLRALDGDRAGALRVYHTCATTLQRELSVEPGPATHQVYEDLLQADARPAAARRTAPGISPLVGREEEWARLQTAWRRAVRGPRFLLLLGEAGIGKTRLVEELLDWAQRQGIAQAYARCYAAEGELAYTPVTALLQARPLPPVSDVWLSEVARLLPEILEDRPDLSPPRPMTEAWQRQRLYQALARAVLGGKPAPNPLLLAVEDLQWCDTETLAWLHYLLRFDPQARLLVVGTCRPEELDEDCAFAAALPTLHRDVRLTEIDLGPLDEAQTATLASNVAGEALEATVTERLFHETEGNPLFVVETLRAGLPTADEEPLPPRVQAVLETRLAQLSPPARELAELAATVGRSFAVPVLEQAGEGDEDALVQGLDELWQRRIVRERGADAYDFGHDKLRETAYNLLSPARRRLLHRRVAQALEAVHGADLDPVSRQVASHYRQAGYYKQAVSNYARAGQWSSRLCAYDEAEACCRRGLTLLQEGGWDASQDMWRQEMTAWLCALLGDALQLGQAKEARLAYERAIRETDQGDSLNRARLQGKIAFTWHLQGQYDKVVHALDQAEAILGAENGEQPAGWWPVWLEIQMYRLNVYYPLARWREMAELLAQIGPVVEQFGTPSDRAAFHRNRMFMAMRRDRLVIHDETLADARAMLSEEQRAGDPWLTGVDQYLLGWVLVLRGELDEAQEHLQAALAVSDRIEHPLLRGWTLPWLMVLHRKRGQVEAAEAYAQRALEATTRAGLPEQIGLAQANLSWLAWRKGNRAEAEELGQAALASWQRGQWVYGFQWTAILPLLAVALERGQIPTALDHAEALLDLQQQKLPEVLEAALEVAVRAGEGEQPEEARMHLQRAVRVAQEADYL